MRQLKTPIVFVLAFQKRGINTGYDGNRRGMIVVIIKIYVQVIYLNKLLGQVPTVVCINYFQCVVHLNAIYLYLGLKFEYVCSIAHIRSLLQVKLSLKICRGLQPLCLFPSNLLLLIISAMYQSFILDMNVRCQAHFLEH